MRQLLGLRSQTSSFFLRSLTNSKHIARNALARVATLLIVLSLTAGTMLAQQGAAPIPNGLTNWWRAEGNALDTQSSVNGTLNSGAGYAAGEVGQGFGFNSASNSNITFGNTVGNFGTSDFTVDFWLQTSATVQQAVLGKRAICNPDSFFDVRMNIGGVPNLLVELDQDNVSTNQIYLQPSVVLNDGRFHHVAIVRQGTTAYVYADGALIAQEAAAGVTNISNSALFTMGESACGPSLGTATFQGTLDEIHIFNRALSQTEVQSIYNAGTAGLTTLVGRWMFNEGTGTTTPDASGNGNTGTLSGNTLPNWITDVPLPYYPFSLNFDGVSNYVNVANGATSSSLNFTTQITMAAWVKVSNVQSGAFGIISKPQNGGGAGWSLRMEQQDPDFGLNNGAGFVNCSVHASSNPFTAGVWTHVAATYDSLTSTVQLYVNGVSVPVDSQTCFGPLLASSEPLHIGADLGPFGPLNGVGGGYFPGKISDARVYNRILSSHEIAALATPPPTPVTVCGTVISAPGIYTLQNDLLNCSGNGVSIQTNEVALNLNGHTISSTGFNNNNGVLIGGVPAGVSNVSVVGPGPVSNFSGGVGTSGASYSIINGLTITGNGQGVAINQTFLSGNVRSMHNRFINNTSTGNTYHGFTFNGGDQNTFTGNVSTHNGQTGFLLFDAQGNTLTGNTANQNGLQGIIAVTSPGGFGNTIEANTALGNSGYDLEDDYSGCANTWIGNVYGTVNQSCAGSRPAVLTVTANNLAMFYGASLPSLTYTVSGFVNGDTAAVLSGTPTLSTTATATGAIGSYLITISQGTLSAPPYYTLNFVNGTLSVYPSDTVSSGATAEFLYSGNWNSGNISAFSVNPTTGALSQLSGSPYASGSSLTDIAADPFGRFLYTSNSTGNTINVYAINPAVGTLSSPLIEAGAWNAIGVDLVGRFLYADGGSVLQGYSVDQQVGTLTPFSSTEAIGPNAKFSIAFHPSGKYLYQTNSSNGAHTGTLGAFSIDPNTGALTALPGSPYSADNAISVAADPLGRFVYVGDGFNGTSVYGFAVDPNTGALTPLPGSPFNAVEGRGIATDRSGRFLFVSDEDHGTISAYTIDQNTGALTVVLGSPFNGGGGGPVVDPTNTYLYVGQQGGSYPNNFLWGYRINQTTGALTAVAGSPFVAGSGPWSLSVAVAAQSTTTTLTATSPTFAYGQPVTINAAVYATNGQPLPTGTVTFTDGAGIVSASIVVTNGSATFTTSALGPGTQTITGTYSSGSASLLSSSGSAIFTIPSPVLNTTPTGMVAFTPPAANAGLEPGVGGNVNLGDVFTVNSDVYVTSLGFYAQDPFTTYGNNEIVTIYDSNGNALASATVSYTGPVMAGYYWQNIEPIQLHAGQQYTVSAWVGNNGWESGTAPATPTQISFNDDRYLYASSPAYPTQPSGAAGPAYYGPNFTFVTTAPPPTADPDPNGLIHWWPAEGNALDAVSTANGTLNNGVGFTTGEVGQAFSFNAGSSTNVTFPSSAAAFGTSDFTVDFWFNTTQAESYGNPITLLGNRVDCSDGNFLSVRMYSSNSLFVELDQDGGHTNYNAVQTASGLNDGKWHHVAIVRQGTSLSVYLDGALAGANSSSGITNITGANPFVVGSSPCASAYSGAIDEIHIFNRSLSLAEVLSIFGASTAGLAPPPQATLTVVANNVSKLLGESVPALTYSISGFVNGDTAAVLSGAPALSTTATASSASGSYPITISQGTLSAPAYYTFSFVNGALQVPAADNPLNLQDNYFVTGDYAVGGVTLRGTGSSGMATGTINIPTYAQNQTQGVPDGADIVDAYLYWQTLESTLAPSASGGTFRGYPIVGQKIGNDIPYTDGAFSGTLRIYRADVNPYFPADGNGIRFASGTHTISLPDSGGTALPLTEGASLVVIYRVLSPQFALKSVVIYDGSAVPSGSPLVQVMQGFYDAAGFAQGTAQVKTTNIYSLAGNWNSSPNFEPLVSGSQFDSLLNSGAYAAVVLSTPVNNSDKDGILDAWKTGPPAPDFHAGQSGYYDIKDGSWVGLPGAQHGRKDLFVQLDYMCGAVLSSGTCDPGKENLFPSPDSNGNDPLLMVQQAFASHGINLHVEIGNAIPEDTCIDSSTELCQFPNQTGVVGWKNSLLFSKVWPRNFVSCLTGGDCTQRFPHGQKDSYHYVLFGHSLAVPAWNSRFGTIVSIQVASGVTTIVTADRGQGLQACPSRITISGVLGNQNLNGVYNTTSCSDTRTMTIATPSVSNWSYPNNTLPEPIIGITSGIISSISGYSDLGGADSAVTLGLWETSPNQDMSKKANVIAGTLFHEIGHTLGLTHGGLYFDTPGSFEPTFEANCKPNYQSVMNYLFQLDLIGPTHILDFSSQTLSTLNESQAGSVAQLFDVGNNPATYPTSAWYVPYTPGALASPATRHCDGTPLNGDSSYRVDASVEPILPAWTNGQDINFDGQLNTQMRGYNDWGNIDLRQVGATGGQFDSLSGTLSFGAGAAPVNVGAGGNVTLGSGGTIALGSGGTVTLGSGGNVTLGSAGTIALGSGGNVTLGSGGTVTLGSGGVITAGSDGNVTLGSGGNVTLGSGGTITLGSGGTITLGSGGNVTLGSGGTITLGSGGTPINEPAGTYAIGSGGTVTLGSGGNVTLGSGGNVTLGSGGTIALGSGGTVTLGSGGTVTLGSGGTVTLGSGGNVALGSGGNVILGSGGTITLGSGGNVTLGSGGNVTLGSGGTVTLGSGGNVALGSGGNVTLGSGGTVTLGSGGNVTLGSGGNVTLGSGGTVALGSGGTVTLGSGGNVTLGSGGTVTLGSGGTITLGSGGTVTLGSGGTITLGSGGAPIDEPAGTYAIGSGGTVTLGSGGNVTLGSGGNVTLGSGGTITLGSGGNVTLGSGGNVTLGSGGTITLGSGGTITLGSGGNVTLGSGGVVALGSGGNIALGSGGTIALGSGGNTTLGSGGNFSDELSYETANSVVRPPASPTVTPTAAGARVNWMPPTFGVVSTYTIYRAVNGGTPVSIGTVSGNPPQTTFVDPNPVIGGTSVYTISTAIIPDTGSTQSRQSPPSPPAVVKTDQTIAFAPLPNVQLVDSPVTVTAVSNSGLQVSFTATGNCAVMSGSMTSGVSSAMVSLNAAGSCKVTASQAGTSSFNPATSVSQSFTIAGGNPQSSNQAISFAPLSNRTYGDADFTLSASASSNLQVTFTAGGNCTLSSASTVHITGAGVCAVTASQAGSASYNSAVPATQSFSIAKGNASITVTPYHVAYDGNAHMATATVTGVGGANLSSSLALFTTHTSVGTYATDSWVFTDFSGNYNSASGTLTDIISPALATVSANAAGKTYGDPDPALAATETGFTAADAAAITLSATRAPGQGAGTYTITPAATGAALANYTVTYKTASFTIAKATLTVTADNKTRILDAANPTFTATYAGFRNGETLASSGATGTPSLTTTAITTSPVGPYTITAAGGSLAASNYTFAFVPGKLTILYASSGTCNGSPGHAILPPVYSDGTSIFKGGRTVPIQFRVCDTNGVSIGTPGVVSSFLLTGTYNGTLATEAETVSATNNDTAFRWDSTNQQWIFNLSTSNFSVGQTYIYTITLNDGTIVTGTTFAPAGTASFQFGLR